MKYCMWTSFFEKIKENLELWDIIIIYPCPKPSALLSPKGLVLEATQLSCTYCGQEGIQETARKDSACGKGSAEMQACSWEMPFHSTKLFNKVDVGRIFCKTKGANRKDRQARLSIWELPRKAERGATTWSKDFMPTLGSMWELPLLQYIFLLSKYFHYSVRMYIPLRYLHHQWDTFVLQVHFLHASVLIVTLMWCIFQTRTLLEVKGRFLNNCTRSIGISRNMWSPQLVFLIRLCHRWHGIYLWS